jgi:LuxR family maltose regulon positive regulatory protein
MRVSGDLLEIRQRDLRFRSEEVAAFFQQALPFSLSPDLMTRMEERTEGWAAGLRMAAIALQRAENPQEAAEAFAGSHELLADYLMEEAVGGQAPAIQRFLLETSVLPLFNEEACVAVTGDPRARDHLRAVDEDNLFLVSLDHRQRWFRYHHLFAELLRFRLRQTFPERVEELHDRASRWFQDRGDIQEALSLAAEMESPRRLLEILDTHGYPILARSEFASFARWLTRVPDPLSQPYPMFLAALAWFRAQTERAPDLDHLLGALDASVQDPPAGYPPARLQEARLHLAALRAFAYRVLDRFHQALEAGEEALAKLPSEAITMRGILEFNMGAVHLRLANMDLARRYLERGYESCLKGGVPYLVLAALGHMGSVAANTEGLPAARRRLESAVTFAGERGLAGVPAFAIILYQLAQLHILAHEFDQAKGHLLRALELTRGERDTDIHANVLIHLARVAVGEGAFDEAEEHLSAASALAYSSNVKPFATTLDVEWARLNESRTGRLQVPEEAGPSAETSGFWTTWVEAETVLHLEHALHSGRHEEAGALAARLREESEPRKRGIALCVAEVAQAALTRDARERKELLSAALSVAAARDYVLPLVRCGPPIRSLLEGALKYPLPPRAQLFVRDRILPLMTREKTGTSALPSDEEAWDLTEKEVEILALLSRGLTNAEMARELFLSVNTVKTHLKHVFAKLDVANRTEAVQVARRRGIVSFE